MKLRLPPLTLRPALDRLRRLRTRGESRAEAAGTEEAAVPSVAARGPAELIGLGLAMFVAISLVALIVILAAPATIGCGSRQVGTHEAAPAPAAPAAAPAAPSAAPAPAPATEEPETEAAAAPPPGPSSLVGDYECRFTRGDRELRPVPCSIRDSGGELRLEQAGGAVRLSGTVVEDEAGFRLQGEVTCAAGPCPGPGMRELLFFNQGKSAYSAVLPVRGGHFLNIDIIRAP
jgi:hypothetical protein